MLPRVGDALPDTGEEGENACYENGPSASERIVQGRGEPAPYESAAQLVMVYA